MVLALLLVLASAPLDLVLPDAARAALILGCAGILMSLAICIRFAGQAAFAGGSALDRLLVALLHLLQPLARLRGRIRGHFAAPADLTTSAAATTVRALPSIGRALALTGGVRLERKFWTERWTSLPALLDQLVSALRKQRGAGRVDVDEGWSQRWDVALPIGGFARLEARGLVEEHAQGACLFRVSTRVRATGGGMAALLGLALAILAAMLLERAGRNSASLVAVLACAFALVWGFRRIVLTSARVRAAVNDIAEANALVPIGEGPTWRPAIAGVAAGTLQASMVIAVGAFFLMTAAPTVWDAADDYFPSHQTVPSSAIIRPIAITVDPPPITPLARSVVKPAERRAVKPGVGATQHPPLQHRGTAAAPDRRRT
jgi:hypothetical protein